MTTWKSIRQTALTLSGTALLSAICIGNAFAAPLNIKDGPLFLNETPAPLNMLVMSRDHRMYYEAYNDASDLDGDGILDTHYKPQANFTYFGYFESNLCYTYSGGLFVPAGSTGANKTCSGQWSGDWLNYITTSRIDALRKVLYGGLRSTDTAGSTVLQRAFIPQDAHSWGKDYESVARDGYDISLYTPLAQPTANHRHLFANTTLSGDAAVAGNGNAAVNGVALPKLRVVEDRDNHVWDWVSKERPVAGDSIIGNDTSNVTPTDYIVRVQVCTSAADPATQTNMNCKAYASGDAKPTGLLQDYGENDTMFFGLLTGSYGKPHDGGVLRRAVASVADEIDLGTGQFLYNQNPPGIISTIDRLRITSFSGDSYACGWIATSADAAGDCSMWGNPTAEMMYETLRYFAGAGASNPDFSAGANNGEETSLGLRVATWNGSTDPYGTGKYPTCSKPFETVISDISPSFDSDKVPGSYFGGYPGPGGELPGLSANTIGGTIWTHEMAGSPTNRFFIGQSGGVYDGAPTVKVVNSFANIRGLSPEAPAKEGSYNAASVAYYGLENDVNAANGEQKVQTFAVALASPLPQVKIPVNGGIVTLVPFAKSVGGGYGITPGAGQYQPTNQIVDFYVDTLTPTYGKFRVNFEDVEQGADHDMDAIVIYEYQVVAGAVNVTLTSEYAAGSIIQHMGYVISGSSADGTYLEVRDIDTTPGNDVDYYLDTPGAAVLPAGTYLPLTNTRTFTSGTSASAAFLKDPLWYAAKWGGFKDLNSDGFPDPAPASGPAPEWDADGDGVPDNYFLVTNARNLKAQLSAAFNAILDRSGSASSASVSSGSISSDTRVYQATFDSRRWAGQLLAFPILDGNGGAGGTVEGAIGPAIWDAATVMPTPNLRKLFTVVPVPATPGTTGVYGRGVPFRWATIGPIRQAQLDPTTDGNGQIRLDYLRGDRTQEQPGGLLRQRDSVLGDIVDSAPIFVGAPPFRYPDSMESVPYSSFRTANLNREKVVYAGANDGIMHAFDATNGAELFGYVPHGVFRNLVKLTDPAYGHLFYADGTPSVIDAFFTSDTAWHTVLAAGLNKGGQSVYALDVTDPGSITEANADSTVLWEFTDREDSDLGYTYSRPAIVKMKNGKWAAVFGNGYNNMDTAFGADPYVSATGNAALYVVDIETGVLIKKIPIPAGAAQDPTGQNRPNGLATPAVIDLDGDSRVDYAYAGDLFGNLWKFDLTSANVNNWRIANQDSGGVTRPLFVARNAASEVQPITERPTVGPGPNGAGMVVLFGTGKFLEPIDRDISTLHVQSFYGIYDANTGGPGDIVASDRSTLQQQTILAETTTNIGGTPVGVRVTSDNNVDSSTQHGWYLDFLPPAGFQGEMQVSDPVLRNGRVVFTTLIPDSDICAYGGRSWLMSLNALSGSRLTYSPFDLNNDDHFTAADFVTVSVGGVNVAVPVSGTSSDSILSRPAILAGEDSEHTYSTDTSGRINNLGTNPGPGGIGRQSWRQLR